ncbi:MAG: hypothetical protein A3H36_08475 [Chloroflexi bacterium RIFCSPLOWO2_02_FULL_71_16]|nr:MAG: hypothetical protein A3H36_08475 [Chloroflexi bacterium RIFCSPLOWO2_02_FULL_71_16]
MRRELADLIGSGLLLLALGSATIAALAPTTGAGAAPYQAATLATDPSVERGQLLFFAKGCVACHRIAGVSEHGGIGPDLTSLDKRAATQRPGLTAPEYVRESLREPNAFISATVGAQSMPDLDLTDEEIEALTAFLLAPDPN